MEGQNHTEPEFSRVIHLRPRYFRLCTDPGIEETEKNYRYRHLNWHIPLNEIALVCLDVWNYHFSADTLKRIEDITTNKIVPLVKACRKEGLQVIHAPASSVAQKHPNWVGIISEDQKPQPEWPNSPVWPPEDFRKKKGRYIHYARPHEPQEKQRNRHRQEKRDFHPTVRPIGNEAVVLNGEELHRLCNQRGILFLLYVGFNTNACIVMRDYGVWAMHSRGYEIILVGDCTTGMETHETQPDLVCTEGQIATLEQFGVYTMLSEHIIKALSQVCSDSPE